MIRHFIGPMSKNIVDAILQFEEETEESIGFIPSRRQVEFDGGYVNNWTTEQFRKYVGPRAFITRDHAGPGQGLHDDDGYISLTEDCVHFDMIHIDPWKKYSDFDSGLDWTVDMIKHCYKQNQALLYEVGTEQSIRRFEAPEIEALLKGLEQRLTPSEFNRVEYCVIQSGTSLKGNVNTGEYDKQRLLDMVSAVKKYDLQTKEHNGDYLPIELMKEKFEVGLDCINIAPEFGQIETKTYLNAIKQEKPELLFEYWQICYTSNRWRKWVDKSFEPWKQKEELINICGHYVLSDTRFLTNIKDKFENIDETVRTNVNNKLKELFYG